MHMRHEIDMVVDRGIQLILRSPDLNKKTSWGGRLFTDHVPGGIMIKLGECSCTNTQHIREHNVE
jgi:hypothetical protein